MKISILALFAVFGIVYGKECHPDYFECHNGGCVPDRWRCDGENDCEDGSDELRENCLPCDEALFTCDNGRCVGYRDICNSEDNCGDMSDEVNPVTGKCPPCPGGTFQCFGSQQCVPAHFKCDTEDDCGDASDESELACPCRENEIRCSQIPGNLFPGPCIPPEYFCDVDGIWDCPLGEDEENCTRSG